MPLAHAKVPKTTQIHRVLDPCWTLLQSRSTKDRNFRVSQVSGPRTRRSPIPRKENHENRPWNTIWVKPHHPGRINPTKTNIRRGSRLSGPIRGTHIPSPSHIHLDSSALR